MSDPRTVWPKVEPGTACPDCGAILHGYPCIHHEDGCSVLKVVMGGADTGAVGERPQHGTRGGVNEVHCAVHGWVGNIDWHRQNHDQHAPLFAPQPSGGAVGEREEPPLNVERLIRAERETPGPAFPMDEFLRRLAIEYARLSVNEGGVAPPDAMRTALERLVTKAEALDAFATWSALNRPEVEPFRAELRQARAFLDGVAPVEPQEPRP